MLYFLFERPNKIADEKSLDKLYLLTFQTIKVIRTKISESFVRFAVNPEFQNDLIDRLIHSAVCVGIIYRCLNCVNF
jgi:hypothetical protein